MGAVLDWIFSGWEKVAAILAILSAALALFAAIRNAANGYILLRRMNAGRTRGSRRWVIRTLIHLGVHNFSSLLLRETRFLRHVRVRVEHEIFTPRPVWTWPLSDDDDNYGKPGFSLDFRGIGAAEIDRRRVSAKKAARAAFDDELAEWKAAMRKLDIGDAEKPPRIELKLAGELNDALSDIKRYFDTLKTLGIEHLELKFVCEIFVKSGFIANQHLLSGLLVRFNDKWDHIIRGFEEASESGGSELRALPRDLRQIQSFIYYCWLLWGPSIPVCGPQCDAWNADFATLQFGYGDENNSIELVGEHGWLREQFAERIRNMPSGAMAAPASVWGELQYSSIVDHSDDALPAALKAAWQGRQDERPILLMSSRSKGKTMQGELYERPGGISSEKPAFRSGQSRYYSAYLWVMFVLLRNDGTAEAPSWLPVNAVGRGGNFKDATAEPWMAAIPFFEHGNLADPETCAFSKEQLADKAVGGLRRMHAMFPAADRDRYRFAYVCGIDDPNCSKEPAFPELAGGTRVIELIRNRVDGAPDAALFDLAHYRPGEAGAKQGEKTLNPHSACLQTDWVSEHYRMLESVRAG